VLKINEINNPTAQKKTNRLRVVVLAANKMGLMFNEIAPSPTPNGLNGFGVSFTTEEFHRITLSARASTFGGIIRPICLAVFKLTTNSNFVGASIGKSPGLAPFRI
jgi:hypothetical protein